MKIGPREWSVNAPLPGIPLAATILYIVGAWESNCFLSNRFEAAVVAN